jgi:hypothetical protein
MDTLDRRRYQPRTGAARPKPLDARGPPMPAINDDRHATGALLTRVLPASGERRGPQNIAAVSSGVVQRACGTARDRFWTAPGDIATLDQRRADHGHVSCERETYDS